MRMTVVPTHAPVPYRPLPGMPPGRDRERVTVVAGRPLATTRRIRAAVDARPHPFA